MAAPLRYGVKHFTEFCYMHKSLLGLPKKGSIVGFFPYHWLGLQNLLVKHSATSSCGRSPVPNEHWKLRKRGYEDRAFLFSPDPLSMCSLLTVGSRTFLLRNWMKHILSNADSWHCGSYTCLVDLLFGWMNVLAVYIGHSLVHSFPFIPPGLSCAWLKATAAASGVWPHDPAGHCWGGCAALWCCLVWAPECKRLQCWWKPEWGNQQSHPIHSPGEVRKHPFLFPRGISFLHVELWWSHRWYVEAYSLKVFEVFPVEVVLLMNEVSVIACICRFCHGYVSSVTRKQNLAARFIAWSLVFVAQIFQ